MISDDEGYRIFGDILTQTVARHKYFGAELLARQRDQFVELVRLERQFREGLVGTEEGVEVYNRFVTKVCDENILTSRPFFRERQEVCIGPITRALKQRFVQDLYQYNVNYNFVAFALKCRTWEPGHPLVAVAKAINKLRQEIVTLNMPLAISQASVFWLKAPLRTQDQRFSFMDFVQVAADGLLSAVDKFVLPVGVEDDHLLIRVWRAVAIGRMRGNFIEMFSLHRATILHPCGQRPKKIEEFVPGDEIVCVDDEGKTQETEVVALHDHGMVEGHEVTFDDGYQLVCSAPHKFLTQWGMVALGDIVLTGLGVLSNGTPTQTRWVDGALRDNVSYQEGTQGASEGMSDVSRGRSGGPQSKNPEGYGDAASFGRVEDSMWPGSSNSQASSRPPQRLSRVSGYDYRTSGGTDDSMEEGASRGHAGKVCQSQGCVSSSNESRSSVGGEVEAQNLHRPQGLAKGTSRADVREYEEGLVCSKALQDGGVASFQRGSGLGWATDPLWRKTQASGFCEPGSQDLGGSGRTISFQGSSKKSYASFPDGSISRRDAERRSIETPGCDVDQASYDLFLLGNWSDASGLAPMAYSDAPLASTRGLVLRRIVRVRYVGFVHMYDLEVAHPKHNFLLPNGVVTSNSETSVHFFPGDKRKMYRANKHLRDFQGPLDYDILAQLVNRDLGPDGPQTTGVELADLMGAAASSVVGETEQEEGYENPLQKAQASPEWRPDVRAEANEMREALFENIERLSVLEQKILRLKGVEKESL